MFPSDCAEAASTRQRGAAELGLRSSETWGDLDYKSCRSAELDVELVDGQPEEDEEDGEADGKETNEGARQVAFL